MSLGLPTINMVFKAKGVSVIERSARGIVACILKDSTEGGKGLNVYGKVEEVKSTEWKEQNFNYLKLIFAGVPSRVLVIRIEEEADSYNAALMQLKDLRWNYLCIPGLAEADVNTLATWVKQYRNDEKKTFKAVLPHCKGDHEGVINLTTENIVSSITGLKHSAAEYCARIAGVLAGLSLERSSTYFVLEDISSAEVPDNPNERINNGEMIIVFDGRKYKIGRGVNSLVTFSGEKTEDMRKIKIIESMDLYMDDIRDTYEENYVGKVINDYDHKQAFVAAIGTYHKELSGNVLDGSFENKAGVDIEAQRAFLEGKGQDTLEMDDTAVAKANTGSKVFIASNIKFIDAMEDLQFTVNM